MLQLEIVRAANTLSRKAVIRLDTGVKRNSCARCDTVLVEGLTATTRSRVSGPHDHILKRKCLVCGGCGRVPAPNLLPLLEGSDGKGEKRERQEEMVEAKVGKEKVSQRSRRRTGSIKKDILRSTASNASVGQSSTTEPSGEDSKAGWSMVVNPPKEVPVKEKLSRRKKREQRQARLSARATTSSPTIPVAPARARRKVKPNPRLVSEWEYFSSPSPEPISSPALNETEPDTTSVETGRGKGRVPRPQLPHFNDRVQGSDWDSTLTALQSHLSEVLDSENPEEVTAYAGQALEYWTKAARSRGDHLVVSGVGKNGSLGASLP